MKRSKTEHSLKKRFVFKLTSSIVKIVAGLATLGFVPRALGVELYGDFGFLTVFFNKAVKLLKMGFATAYFVKISKNPANKTIIGFYVYFALLLSVVLLSGVSWISNSSFQEVIFPSQQSIFIFAACFLAILRLFSDFFNATNDAFGYTVQNETIIIVSTLLNAIFISLMYFTNTLTLGSVFGLNFIIFLFLVYLSNKVLFSNNITIFKYLKLTRDDFYTNLSVFYKFSNPLVINVIITVFAVIIDRWLLQYYYGSTEQGYYTIALQISIIIMLFSNSASSLLLRDVSQKSVNDKEGKEVKKIFTKYNAIFYFIAAFFGIFISLNSDVIVKIVGGDEYKGAGLVVSVMIFYSIYHAYSMNASNILLSNESTKILRNVTLLTILPGIPLSFLILSPIDSGGLGYGAIGLAVKTVAIQFIAGNMYLWFASNILKISFLKHFLNQFLVLIVVFLLAKVSQFLSVFLLDGGITMFIFSGVIYLLLITVVIKIFPRLVGLSSKDLGNILIQLKQNRLFCK